MLLNVVDIASMMNIMMRYYCVPAETVMIVNYEPAGRWLCDNA